ncbi:SPOR domain-containing protein [Tepidimonas sp.]|uniref:SPOR domain-containing protein n=1 Tax=Tepidimonas sp. TaxID=2002775 RepID=UPI002FDF21ED
MLRLLALVLLLANAALWAWQMGWLGAAPLDATAEREPQRLAQQIAPERLRLLNPPGQTQPLDRNEGTTESNDGTTAAATDAEPQTAIETGQQVDNGIERLAGAPPAARLRRHCWQLDGLAPAQAEAVRRRAGGDANLRARQTEQTTVLPARWIVYLGKFSSAEALQRRRAALRQAGIDHRVVNVAALMPGLALGTFSTEQAAQRALQDMQRRGVTDARVVQERSEMRLITLRWPDLTAEEEQRLRAALQPELASALSRCR